MKAEKRNCVNIKMMNPIYLTDDEYKTLEVSLEVKVGGKIISNSVTISKAKGKDTQYTISPKPMKKNIKSKKLAENR